jgi:hypothetical protein
MPSTDISFCHGIGCEMKTKCHRHVSIPKFGFHSFAPFWESPEFIPEKGCDEFWPVAREKPKKYSMENVFKEFDRMFTELK